MANVLPDSDVSLHGTPSGESGDLLMEPDAKHVQERLNKRSRRRVTNIGPLGWWISDVSVALFSSMMAFSFTPYQSVEVRHAGALEFAIVFAVCVGVFSHIFGFHDKRHVSDSSVNIWRIAAVVVLALAFTVLELVALHFLFVGRYILAISFVVCLVGMSALRIIMQHFSENFAQSICFIGDDNFCKQATQFVDQRRKSFEVLDRPDRQYDFTRWAIQQDVDQLVLDPTHLELKDDEQLLKCLDQGVQVLTYPDFLEANYLVVPVDHIDANWLFLARLDLAHPYYHGVKRVFDVVASVIGIMLTAPILLLAIIAIKLESRGGPAFYSQMRCGRFNRPYRIFKLRTMIEQAERDGAKWASASDTRITRIGKILRRTRIDEIPQFWNVLLGDMSLVGPRPERPEFIEMLKKEIPFYVQRHLVTPGLTGWAQINYPYGASVEDSRNKLTYDLYYVKHCSLTLDLQILLRTVGTIMKGSR